MQKIREAMKSSELHKMNDRGQVDEFTIGGKEEYSFRINRSQNKDTIFNKLKNCSAFSRFPKSISR